MLPSALASADPSTHAVGMRNWAALVAYASKHRSTSEIAERIASVLRRRGLDAEARAVGEVSEVETYDGVVIGSAVYFARWLPEATQFLRRHRDALRAVPVWLFSSGPVGDAGAMEPPELADLWLSISPLDHRVFAGKLDRRELGFGERLLSRAVKASEGDYRAWSEIEAWAESIADQLRA